MQVVLFYIGWTINRAKDRSPVLSCKTLVDYKETYEFTRHCSQDIIQPVNNANLAEARAIAKEAYIYGFPMVDSYRIQYAYYFVDPNNPEYKAPWNQIRNIPCIYTPDDKAVQPPDQTRPTLLHLIKSNSFIGKSY